MKKISVVGAGFSGLVTAYFLSKAGWEVEVFEKSNRAGGIVGTEESQWGLVEKGPNGIYNNAAVEKLFADLGLELVPARKEARRRFIYRQGLHQWPLSMRESHHVFLDVIPRLLFWRRSLKPHPQETLSQWGNRLLGPVPTQYLLGPAIQGVYAGDIQRLSATLVMDRFLNRNRRSKPRIRGTIAPAKGMGQLIEHFQSFLEKQGVKIHFGQSYEWKGRKPVVICTSADGAAQLLKPKFPAIGQALEQIEMLPLLSATLFYPKQVGDPQGFGCLFPRSEGFDALGVLYNDLIFDGRSTLRSETWIFGGAHRLDVCDWTDPYVLSKVQIERMKMLGTRSEPQGYRIHRSNRAIPHYTVELEQLQADFQQLHGENIFLVGNYLGDIGLGSIVMRAERLAKELDQTGEN